MRSYLKKIQIWLLIVIASSTSYSPCQAQENVSKKSFKIGWIGSLSGPFVKYGAGQAAALAWEDVNAAGGVLGQKLELIQEDTQSKGQNAVSAFKKLRTVDGVKFILGGHSSPETMPIAALTRSEPVLLLAAITSSPKFTGVSPRALRLTPSSLIVGNLLAKHAREIAGHKTAVVIAEETDYALPAAERFKQVFEELGGKVGLFSTYQSNESDFRALLTKAKAANADTIYLGVQSQDTASIIVKQLRELGLKQKLYGNEVFGNTPQGTPALGSLFAGSFYAEPQFDINSPKTQAFIQRFKSRYNVSALPFGIWTAEAYDSVRLLAETINKCGDDVDKVRDCLLQVKNYPGASGMVSISPEGDGIREYVIKKINAEGKVE